MKLVKLCVAALQRAEQQPLMLFPTQAPARGSSVNQELSLEAMYLPKHLSAMAGPQLEPRDEISWDFMRFDEICSSFGSLAFSKER